MQSVPYSLPKRLLGITFCIICMCSFQKFISNPFCCVIHSNMFLLIPNREIFMRALLIFTFQYVSINTFFQLLCKSFFPHLHSNMFLLILIPYSKIYENLIHLHSNMFLLIQRLQKQENITDWDLHSNMFLLIHKIFIRNNGTIQIYIPICFY